jgi:hypothetical protein
MGKKKLVIMHKKRVISIRINLTITVSDWSRIDRNGLD